MFFRELLCVLLLNSVLGDCTRELTAVLSRFFTLAPTDMPSAMAAASGKWLNDLGDYSACTRIAEAEYALLYVKIEGLFIGVGLCGPKNCSADDYYGILDQLQSLHSIAPFTEAAQVYAALPSTTLPAKLAQSEVQIVFPRTLEPDGLTFGAGLMVGCCILLVVCVAAGTILEAFYVPSKQAVPKLQKDSIELTEIKESYSNPYQKLATEHAKVSDPSMLVQSLLSFSLVSNLPRLFSVSEKDRSNPLFVLNGVRVLSMLWIVLGHVLIFGLAGAPTKNPEAILPYFKQLRGTLLFSAHFAVDTFLWLTGFLLAFILLQKIAVRGDVPKVWQLYLHRVVRILPTLAFTLFLSWTIAAYSARGPLAFSMQDVNKSCEQYWWTNLFFVNNEYPDGLGNSCFGQTWYLAVDMQLYFVAVPLVLLYHSKRSYGWLAGALLCLISVVSSACITWTRFTLSLFASDGVLFTAERGDC